MHSGRVRPCYHLIHPQAHHHEGRPRPTGYGLLLQGINPVREILRILPVQDLLHSSAEGIIAKAGTQPRAGDSREPIAHIPGEGVPIERSQIAVVIMRDRKAIEGQLTPTSSLSEVRLKRPRRNTLAYQGNQLIYISELGICNL